MAEQYTGVEKRHLPRNPITELSYKKFGAPTRVRSTSLTVNTQPIELVRANPNRIALLLVNNSNNYVYLNFLPEVNPSFSIILTPNGASLKMAFDDYGEAVTSVIHGVGVVGTQNVTLIESLVAGVG